MPLPAVLTIQSGINQLRYATLKGIMAAKKKEIRKVVARAAGAGARGSASSALYVPEKGKKTQMIAGSPAEAAKELVRALREEARVIWLMILVIAEQRDGEAESRDRGRRSPPRSSCARRPDHGRACPGAGVDGRRRASWRAADVAEVDRASNTPALGDYTPDGYVQALQQLIAAEPRRRSSSCRTRIRRATSRRSWRRGSTARSSPTARRSSATAAYAFTRPMFQGKLTADVVLDGPAPHFVTFQIGAFRADAATQGGAPAPVRARRRRRSTPATIRQKPEAPFQEAKQAVDLSQAERIVSVGRGIKGAGAHRRSRRSWPRRSAPSSPRRGRSATPAGCRWSGRSAAPARPSRRSCTSRSASPAPSSTWSA